MEESVVPYVGALSRVTSARHAIHSAKGLNTANEWLQFGFNRTLSSYDTSLPIHF